MFKQHHHLLLRFWPSDFGGRIGQSSRSVQNYRLERSDRWSAVIRWPPKIMPPASTADRETNLLPFPSATHRGAIFNARPGLLMTLLLGSVWQHAARCLTSAVELEPGLRSDARLMALLQRSSTAAREAEELCSGLPQQLRLVAERR